MHTTLYKANVMVSTIAGGNPIPNDGSSADKETLYDALGVPENATIDEIKQAYYRLVRQTHPNDNPEIFQKFSEASRTLTDARRRGEYDQHRRSGRRVQVLLDQAAAALERDTQKAVSLLKNAITLAPDMQRPRHLLAHVLVKIEDYSLAEKQFRWLLKEHPRDESLYLRIARCQFLQGNYDAARKTLQTTFALNARYHDALMLQSRMEEVQGNFNQSVAILERAIANDGVENFADMEAFVRLLAVHSLRDDPATQEIVFKRLLAVLPEGDTFKANRTAQRFMHRALELEKDGFLTAARLLVENVKRIPDVEPEKYEEAALLSQQLALAEDARQMSEDTLIYPALRDCLVARYSVKGTEALRAQNLETAVATLQNATQSDPRTLQQSIVYLKHEYGHLAADNAPFLEELLTRINRRLEILGANEVRSMPKTMEPDTDSDRTGRKGILGIFKRRG